MVFARRVSTAFTLAIALLWHGTASAAVQIAFYSRQINGQNFPHAFVTISGTVGATGQKVGTALGFTSIGLSPAILVRSVPGEVVVESPRTVANGRRQFELWLSDDRYRAVRAVIRKWRLASQPSYNLKNHNCVGFVRDLAIASGLRVPAPDVAAERPSEFLAVVKSLNSDRFAASVKQTAPTVRVAMRR